MKKIIANLKLYSGNNKRQTAFFDGYRPLFDIKDQGFKTGMITLLDRKEFLPGDEAQVEIRFLNAEIAEGTKIYFYEAVEPLGECAVIKVSDMGK